MQPRSESFLGACLELVIFVAVAAVMGKSLGIEARTAEPVEIGRAELVEGNRPQRFHDPAGCGAQPAMLIPACH